MQAAGFYHNIETRAPQAYRNFVSGRLDTICLDVPYDAHSDTFLDILQCAGAESVEHLDG